MGSVKIDTHKAEYQFHRISLSDVECIKGLIKFRHMIDTYQGIDINRNEDEAGDIRPMNQELLITYIDLDNLIKRTKLNEKQQRLVRLLMEGYTEDEIARIFKQNVRKIYEQFDVIAYKLKQSNDLSWKYDYMYMNYFKAPWSYRECTCCHRTLPLTDDFFNKEPKGKDGFKSKCKDCR